MKWVAREGLLQQNAANATGTKFYQAGVAYDAGSDMFFGLVGWGAGTPALDFLHGQTQCLGAFPNKMAAQTAVDRKLSQKAARSYFAYNDSSDEDLLPDRVAAIAIATLATTPTPAPVTPVPTPEKSRDADVTWVMALESLNDTQAQQALTVRQNLLNDRAKLLQRLDVIDSQVELINAKLIS